MKEDEIKVLLTEHHDVAVKAFKRMTNEVAALREEIRILRRIVASGEQLEFPWFKLPLVRRRQVEAVIAYLKTHTDRTIYTLSRACADTFELQTGGYPTVTALRCYCYSIKLDQWLGV